MGVYNTVMPDTPQPEGAKVDRRTILAGIGAATATGLAGCQSSGNGSGNSGGNGSGNSGGSGSGNSGGNGELGERVPNITVEYWSNVAGTTSFSEDALPIIKKNLSNLGISMNIQPLELASALRTLVNDERSANMQMYWFPSTPDRIDPDAWTVRFGLDYAGGNGRPSPNQYTDCQYTTMGKQQAGATADQQRHQLVNKAHGRMSNTAGVIPLMPNATSYGYRTSVLNLQDRGERILDYDNIPSMVNTKATNESNTIVSQSGPTTLQTTNFLVHNSFSLMAMWNHGINSALLEYDGQYNKVKSLAKNYTVSDDGTEVTVTLADATFHNGDTVTAEDVKFTYEHISGNAGTFPKATTAPFDSINTEDEKTVRFTFTEPYVPFVAKDMPLWGILHKKSWVEAGAIDNPADVQLDQIIGSGPFQVDSFSRSQSIRLVPFDGHPVWTPKSNVIEKAYRDSQTAFQAFQAGEIDTVTLSASQADQVEGNSDIKVIDGPNFMNQFIAPQMNFGPTMFEPFRKAVAAVIDRQKINQIAYLGRGKPDLYSAPCHKSHPWRPPNDTLYQMTDKLQGDLEAAKKHLTDAGWGWDGNGNLHYPSDADLSPKWPQGKTPDYSNFPCVNQDGEYVPKDQR